MRKATPACYTISMLCSFNWRQFFIFRYFFKLSLNVNSSVPVGVLSERVCRLQLPEKIINNETAVPQLGYN